MPKIKGYPQDRFGLLMLNKTKPGGKTWDSGVWNNGTSRTIAEGDFDSFDSRLKYLNGSPSTTNLRINGTGEAYNDTFEFNSSCRIFVYDTWYNTEMTCCIYKDNDVTLDQVTLRSRSRHEATGLCSFGNYVHKWRDTTTNEPPDDSIEKEVEVEVEVMHPHYRRHLDRKTLSGGLPHGQWIGLKQITQDITSSGFVKVQGLINYDITKQSPLDWIKCSEYIINGSNLSPDEGWKTDAVVTGCTGLGDGTADKMIAEDPTMFLYTQNGQHCWFRMDGASTTKVKFFSIREINPIP